MADSAESYSDADLNLQKKHLLSFPDATWQEFDALAALYQARGSLANASGMKWQARLRGAPLVAPVAEQPVVPDHWADV